MSVGGWCINPSTRFRIDVIDKESTVSSTGMMWRLSKAFP